MKLSLRSSLGLLLAIASLSAPRRGRRRRPRQRQRQLRRLLRRRGDKPRARHDVRHLDGLSAHGPHVPRGDGRRREQGHHLGPRRTSAPRATGAPRSSPSSTVTRARCACRSPWWARTSRPSTRSASSSRGGGLRLRALDAARRAPLAHPGQRSDARAGARLDALLLGHGALSLSHQHHGVSGRCARGHALQRDHRRSARHLVRDRRAPGHRVAHPRARQDDDPPAAPEVFACSRALQGSGSEGLSLFGANGIAERDGALYVSVTSARWRPPVRRA